MRSNVRGRELHKMSFFYIQQVFYDSIPMAQIRQLLTWCLKRTVNTQNSKNHCMYMYCRWSSVTFLPSEVFITSADAEQCAHATRSNPLTLTSMILLTKCCMSSIWPYTKHHLSASSVKYLYNNCVLLHPILHDSNINTHIMLHKPMTTDQFPHTWINTLVDDLPVMGCISDSGYRKLAL